MICYSFAIRGGLWVEFECSVCEFSLKVEFECSVSNYSSADAAGEKEREKPSMSTRIEHYPEVAEDIGPAEGP
ncbi:unnamed protein product [Nesidiocoris tenuis]|uniref:Uncharacterized protein n=1 Tax=Nesidiocoris tenuis TaxID=355587 RepID=A0A6H5G3H5_9HEMI|nr:unnamed protein product [Nesidiocoris tenuis]